MAPLSPAEIQALARILDELDYYEILGVARQAPASAIKRAYHAASRRFHPDGYRQLDAELRAAIGGIAKRVTESYCVLRDPGKRRAYDQRLASAGRGLRMQLGEARVEAEREAREARQGRTPNGRRYFGLATSDLARGHLDAALRHVKTALAFEPDNAQFREKLHEIQQKLR